ncbi:MAG TPA: endolytic transglycosylase MltG [Candidatus Merdenecus merdavium]|nr:endolytic transglycosylase MltG [Candidatus Merdenecus merdavium]
MSKKNVLSSITLTAIRLTVYVIIIVAIIAIGKSAYKFGYAVFADRNMSDPPGVEVTVTIKPRTSTYKIGKLLLRKGLIKDAKVFVVQEKLSDYRGKILPGSYILNTSYDVNKILAILSREESDQTTPAESESIQE